MTKSKRYKYFIESEEYTNISTDQRIIYRVEEGTKRTSATLDGKQWYRAPFPREEALDPISEEDLFTVLL
jgi:hypothetical protein